MKLEQGDFAAVIAAALLLVPPSAFTQVRAGGEFQVNVATTGDQLSPAVSIGGTGDFVVVWSSSANNAILGRRHGVTGAALGAEFRVDEPTSETKAKPTVASHRRGNFVVAWEHRSAPKSVRLRRFDPAAQPVTGEMASSFLQGGILPRLDGAPNGWFLVGVHAPGSGTFAIILLHPDGSLACGRGGGGGERGVAVTLRPDLSALGFEANSFSGVRAEHILAPPCTFPPTSTIIAPGPVNPAADSAADNAVLVWTSPTDGDQTGIRGLRLDNLGNPLGAEFQVNAFTTGAQTDPSIAMADDGSFIVAWQSGAGDGDSDCVFARRFRADGTPREGDFVVNSYTTGAQRLPVAAGDGNGNFVVSWESHGAQDGDGGGVFAQRFGGIRAAALAVDPAGNGVLEPNEAVDVLPAWRNVNGSTQSFTGSVTSFTGPGGQPNTTYLLQDANADYGVVPNGATGSCAATGDCHAVAVGHTGSRPALHWDAALREEIAPAGLGQSEVWALHLGDSFADVPRSSVFYRFVETLLHNGVTGGCTASSYCPMALVTREQMPTFVLVAKEGSDYADAFFPFRCSSFNPSPFADVPNTSPFCRWIRELAARGVVAGCGGGNYCPTAAVSREQMAVFVLATLEGPGYAPPPCIGPPFVDVPSSSPFCPWIRELAVRGVVAGCAPGVYCPTAPVTREQMAVFLTVSFGLRLYGP